MLRKQSPISRISNKILKFEWNPRMTIDFKNLLSFATRGFAFIYRSSTAKWKMFFSRFQLSHFVGVERERDSKLFLVFIPSQNSVRILRKAYFHPCSEDAHPLVSNFIDGLCRQHSVDVLIETESDAEENFRISISSISFDACESKLKPHTTYLVISDGLPLPTSFHISFLHPNLLDAIYREYFSLLRRKTWRYISRPWDMNPVPFNWIFHPK